MGDQLDLSHPDAHEHVYRDWGEVPPLSRPLMQGDVFQDVALPDFDEPPAMIQVVAHPCSMRRGTILRSRMGVAPLNLQDGRIGKTIWKKNLRVMPLPELLGPGKLNYLVDLTERTSVKSERLDLTKRVATLSNDGILLLQQRVIMNDTRLLVPLDRLYEVNRHVLTETELQEDWADTALEGVSEGDIASALVKANEEFDEWLGAGDPSRRDKLRNPINHAELRREARREARSRYSH
ncbi:hypothetical protein HII36_33005 [Nonomuraea sp. NN258]|uniref:hypothetical protein n=1 Tax=Nonomuraea antri TaxID=2730852 RepID=UPI001569D1BF|nr:hypothetical protein [Nonomuraea antri]NRQ36619.1 hypothetical protein [Nonomuraea antri]